MGSWDTFKDFKRSTQAVLILSFLFGVALLYLLWTADINFNARIGLYDPQRPSWMQQVDANWLNNHSYVANILNTATGFFIGAPFAVIILATFTAQREATAQLRSINSMTAFAWQRFTDSVSSLCTDQRIEALETLPPKARDIHNDIYHCLRDYHQKGAARSEYPEWNWLTTEEEHDTLKKCLEPLIPRFQQVAFNDLGDCGLSDQQLRVAWASVSANWSTLEQYVRLRRLELSLEWLDDELYGILGALMARSGNPIMDFTELHEADMSNLQPGIQAAHLTTLWYANGLSKEELDARIGKKGTTGPEMFFNSDENLATYVQRGIIAARFFRDLRETVEKVNDANWPASAIKPKKN